MPKRKKTGRTRSQAEIHAEQAARRDDHTRMVFERQGDPTFVQQTRTATGKTVTWQPGSQTDQAMRSGMEAQRIAFVEKFGREPGPEDPIFFDPDEDEPVMLTPEKQAAMLKEAQRAIAAVDPAYAAAFGELGYLVSEQNQHLFTAHEVQAWDDAVDRARDSLE